MWDERAKAAIDRSRNGSTGSAIMAQLLAAANTAHPSATPQDSCRLDWGLDCAGTGGGSGRTEATSSSPSPTAAAGRSSFAAGVNLCPSRSFWFFCSG